MDQPRWHQCVEWGPNAPTTDPPGLEGSTAIAADSEDLWVTYPRLPYDDAEHRECILLAVNPNRHYNIAAEVYEDPAIHGVWHGTDCAKSLWLALHDGLFLDPHLPDCQRLAAGGSFRSVNLYRHPLPQSSDQVS